MNRNRIAALLLALVMLTGMLPSALAANETYKLTVTITDSGEGAANRTVTDYTNYLTGDTNLVATIGALVAGNYESLKIFESPAMRDKLDRGLEAYTNSSSWSDFVTREMAGASGDLLPLIADFDTVMSLSLLEKAAALASAAKEEEAGAAPDIDPGLAAKIEAMIAERAEAKAAKNYARADEIRGELTAMGVTLKDSKEGTTYTIG